MRDGAELVVAVGGDGTLNEAVNGLMQAGTTADLATIPLGTGMDFVRTYRIPTRFEDAVRTSPLRCDAQSTSAASRIAWDGQNAERYVANVGSIGMSAAVADTERHVESDRRQGDLLYALVRVFLEWQNTMVRVEFEGGDQREARMRDRSSRTAAGMGARCCSHPRRNPTTACSTSC